MSFLLNGSVLETHCDTGKPELLFFLVFSLRAREQSLPFRNCLLQVLQLMRRKAFHRIGEHD